MFSDPKTCKFDCLPFVLQIDAVGNPSWQAQIKGTKKWTLEPPPECAHVCDPKLEVTVNSGEISMYKLSLYMFLLFKLKKNQQPVVIAFQTRHIHVYALSKVSCPASN